MDVLKYDRFEIRPALRQLWVAGAVSPLGARAFDLLMLLERERERVVSKEEILAKVWPGLVVEENNLSVQISALRRALGAGVITTVTGRGYRFTASTSAQLAVSPGEPTSGNLPVRLGALFGRDKELQQLHDAYSGAVCVTVCGLAGVGKTAIASTAAHRLATARSYAHGAWLVELTDVRDPALLVQAVCETLGIELQGRHAPLRECVAQLQHREMLLMLDNCEHVIDAAARFVEALLTKAGRVHVLATSQEPLRVAGERVMRLHPLAVPSSSDAENAQAYGAVCMLLERVRAGMGGNFEPSRDEFADLVEICKQLDGIPLALEFAASRVPLLGFAGVRSRLNDCLRLLVGGPRTAPARHRSLQAALEWSHQLLSAQAQRILHRLAVFPSGFSFTGAKLLLEAGTDSELSVDLMENLNVLVDRSLIAFQPDPEPRYRMLEPTRAFALDCLGARGDGIDWQERFALTMCKVCLLAARERDSTWMWQEMPNARAALAWALAAPGHGDTAVTIATYTSVVQGAGGAHREALENLLRVQHLLTESTPMALAARYWHWLGRLGVEGRLPSSLCVDALQRADAMFTQLGEPRHRHACQRHLAEAALRSGHVDAAEQYLRAAQALEQDATRPADRMRRLRVEALLADARQQHSTALRHAQAALTLAEAHNIDRYRMLLMADMAWTHLQAGQSDAAVAAFEELLMYLDRSPRQILARARALSGLTAALVAAHRIDDAVREAQRSVPVLQQANLLRSRCDVLAWVAAASGAAQAAAQLIGAGEDFSVRTETKRDPISQLAQQRTLERIDAKLSAEDGAYWRSEGSNASEAELVHLLDQVFVGRCAGSAT